MATAQLRPPSYARLALEQLAWFEYGTFAMTSPWLTLIPRGDGHPVLVLPGFAASDRSTQPLRALLRLKGYGVHGWDLGSNLGPNRSVIEGMVRRIERMQRRHDQPVSIIGWSLGGVYARELARAYPDSVRQVITLASPFRFRHGDRGFGTTLYNAVASRRELFEGRDLAEEDRPPLPVPASAIYTRTDGIVRWHACIDSVGPRRENIEVIGTHSGLAVNLAAVVAITDRLAQPAPDWRPFRSPPFLRHLYPRPASWRPAPGTRLALAGID